MHSLKGTHVSSSICQGIVHKFSTREDQIPSLEVISDQGLQQISQALINNLRLNIGLWMKYGRKLELGPQ